MRSSSPLASSPATYSTTYIVAALIVDWTIYAELYARPGAMRAAFNQFAAFAQDVLHDVDVMVKDSTRFADSGGWGWAYQV